MTLKGCDFCNVLYSPVLHIIIQSPSRFPSILSMFCVAMKGQVLPTGEDFIHDNSWTN